MRDNLREMFAALVGADGVATGDALGVFRIGAQHPQCAVFPSSPDALAACLAAAHTAGLAVVPAGNGTRLDVGRPPEAYDIAVSTQRLRRIVAHEAADMTVTVEAGVVLGDLNTALAAAGQHLPLDPPLPHRATLGAVIASDACGPWRLAHGKVRDLLIGITVVLADGTVVHGGGRVVKNVAGYDLMKLFTGSHGTLGVIAEATFKVRPRPQFEARFIVLSDDLADAAATAQAVQGAAGLAPIYLELLNRRAATQLALEADAWPHVREHRGRIDGPALIVGVAGDGDEIGEQWNRFQELTGRRDAWMCQPQRSEALYAALRDFPAGGDDGSLGCRLSVAAPKQLGEQSIEISLNNNLCAWIVALTSEEPWQRSEYGGVPCCRIRRVLQYHFQIEVIENTARGVRKKQFARRGERKASCQKIAKSSIRRAGGIVGGVREKRPLVVLTKVHGTPQLVRPRGEH